MLNYLAFQKLGDQDVTSDAALRLFTRLMRDYDLSSYRALSLRTMRSLYGLSHREIFDRIQELTRSGLLEVGPRMPRSGQTYRIGRQYLEDQRDWFQALRVVDDLREIAPR